MAAPRVAVVGAGLIGLSTALRIAEVNPNCCSITLLSEQFSPNTTSDVAAGMLIPHTYPGACQLVCQHFDKSTFSFTPTCPVSSLPPCVLPLFVFSPSCVFDCICMQAHRSTCRNSGSKRPSPTFLLSATQPRRQRLAFTWSLGKSSRRAAFGTHLLCAAAGRGFFSEAQVHTSHRVALRTIFPRNCTAAGIVEGLERRFLTYTLRLFHPPASCLLSSRGQLAAVNLSKCPVFCDPGLLREEGSALWTACTVVLQEL